MPSPKISVLIACVNGLPYIEACLEALARQRYDGQAEVIVANCCGDGTEARIAAKFPQVKLIQCAERLTIPELRALCLAHSTGDIVAVTEDHCIAEENWYTEMLKAHQAGYHVVGGSVINGACERVVDWAVFFCEYSRYMPPLPGGTAEDLPGMNVAYTREVLEQDLPLLPTAFWESVVHPRLVQEGVRLFSVPSMVVYHKKYFGFWYFISQRFHYSRYYAGTRVQHAGLLSRGLFVVLSPLLPGLLLARMARDILRKRRYVKEFMLALPVLAAFTVSWAVGEWWGSLWGPGDSLRKVE